MKAGRQPQKPNASRAHNVRGKKHGKGKEHFVNQENNNKHLFEDNSEKSSLQMMHDKIQRKIYEADDVSYDSPEVSKEEETGIQKKPADVQSKKEDSPEISKKESTAPGIQKQTNTETVNVPYSIKEINTSNVLLTEHPEGWNNPSKIITRLPQGTVVEITDPGTDQPFNTNITDRAYEWVKVKVKNLPLQKGINWKKMNASHCEGWIMSKFLSDKVLQKEVEVLKAAPDAFSGIVPYVSVRDGSGLPEIDYTISAQSIEVGPYTITPQVKEINGVPFVMYYTVADYTEQIHEYVVGPDSLQEFINLADTFKTIGYLFRGDMASFTEEKEYHDWIGYMNFLSSQEEAMMREQSEKHWMSYSQKAVESAMNDDWDAAWKHLGDSWVGDGGALKSADWWMYMAGSTLGGVRPRRPGFNIKVPKNWIKKPSQKGGGSLFQDPTNPHNSIRQMPGNPKSPNPAQKNPYIIFKKNGVTYDVNGNPLKNSADPAAHIPLDQFNLNKMPKFD